ncbi:MAG: hypothetical protein FJ294_07610 [Planctomycetes bacterium]|nr:hypothetical protein [Planctomycetota bacterium]
MKLTALFLPLALLAACQPLPEPTAVSWVPAETNAVGTPAAWTTTLDAEYGRIKTVTTDNTGHNYNLLLSEAALGPDVSIRTRLRANSGVEDQGGGVVWRARDAANYYITRWNPLENNLRIYKVENEKRTQLASISGELPKGWLDLSVSMRGPRILVACGSLSLGVEDTTFAAAGKVGLWTKADACTSFTLPQIETLR